MHSEDRIGHIVGHYRIIRSLGYGGSALVFLAQDINLQREVAVKVFQPNESDSDTQGFLRRFAREARVLAQLDHPNILPVYDYGEQDGSAYLIIPFMAGGSLKDYLSHHRVIAPTEAVRLIEQTLNALQYAHERGLIHRDIKPGNMLFKADGTLVLSDFGLVKIISPDSPIFQPGDMATQTHVIAGTPDYMAPEQALGKVVPASDIYSTGIVLYEMLAGKRPFSSDNYVSTLMKQLHEPPPSLQPINPTVSSALEIVVMRALEKEPEKRFQQPNEMLAALKQAIHSTRTDEGATIVASAPASSSTSFAGYDTPVRPEEQSELHLKQPVTPTGLTQPAITPMQLASTTPASLSNTPPRHATRTFLLTVAAIFLIIMSVVGTLFASHVLGPYLSSTTPTPLTRQTATMTKGGTQSSPTVTVSNTQGTQVLTTCPATGTARAATMPSPILGNDQNIIYIVNEGTLNNPTFGTIKRRDITAYAQGNKSAVEIKKMPGVHISEGQVSRDGAWVLFGAIVAGQYQLRLVRVDGQYLQTLYCATTNDTITHIQWSFDQRSIAFNEGATLYLLDDTNGQVQPELLPDPNTSYTPLTWLDNSHLIVKPTASGFTNQHISVLDTQQGASQQSRNLSKLLPIAQNCFSFDTSYDLKSLFFSTCDANATSTGSSSGTSQIIVQPIAGGAGHIIYTGNMQAITTVRAVTPTALLFTVENANSGDTQSGLWMVNTDGSGVSQLSQDPTHILSLCPFSQYAWSNVSRDDSMYALQGYDQQTNTYSLYYGSLGGSSATQFADISNTQLFLVGWTTM